MIPKVSTVDFYEVNTIESSLISTSMGILSHLTNCSTLSATTLYCTYVTTSGSTYERTQRHVQELSISSVDRPTDHTFYFLLFKLEVIGLLSTFSSNYRSRQLRSRSIRTVPSYRILICIAGLRFLL